MSFREVTGQSFVEDAEWGDFDFRVGIWTADDGTEYVDLTLCGVAFDTSFRLTKRAAK